MDGLRAALPAAARPAQQQRPRLRHPARPALAAAGKTIEAKELAENAGYSRPHTLHCGPDGIFLSCLGGADGDDGPGGIALLDHTTFDVLRRVGDRPRPAVPGLRRLVAPQPERRGHQRVGHAVDDRGRARPRAAARPEVRPRAALLGPRGGPAPADGRPRRASTRWCWSCGRPRPRRDLGVRRRRRLAPRTCPRRCGGGTATATAWAADKVITIPAEPADRRAAPAGAAALRRGAAAGQRHRPVRRRPMLYVSCWGTGELKQYDVTDPAHPREVGSVRLGGIVGRAAHPAAPDERLAGGPQMVEVSRDGRRVYLTNSLYGAWDDQFYPDGVGAWMAKIDADPDGRAGGRPALLPARRRLPRAAGAPGPAAGRRRLVGLVLLPVSPGRPDSRSSATRDTVRTAGCSRDELAVLGRHSPASTRRPAGPRRGAHRPPAPPSPAAPRPAARARCRRPARDGHRERPRPRPSTSPPPTTPPGPGPARPGRRRAPPAAPSRPPRPPASPAPGPGWRRGRPRPRGRARAGGPR